MHNQQSIIDVFNNHVNEYTSKFMDLSLYSDSFDNLINLLPQGANVIELGCGPGNVVNYLKTRRKDLNIVGIDLSPEMIKEAEKQNPGSEFKLMDIRNADRIGMKYDAVIAAFCLPYITYDHPDAFFQTVLNISAPGALFYLSFMEGTQERSGYEETSFTGDEKLYIRYYERNNIISMLEKYNYMIESFFYKLYPEADGSQTTELIYLTRNGTR